MERKRLSFFVIYHRAAVPAISLNNFAVVEPSERKFSQSSHLIFRLEHREFSATKDHYLVREWTADERLA